MLNAILCWNINSTLRGVVLTLSLFYMKRLCDLPKVTERSSGRAGKWLLALWLEIPQWIGFNFILLLKCEIVVQESERNKSGGKVNEKTRGTNAIPDTHIIYP